MSCGPIQDAAKNLAAEIAEAVEAVRKNNPMAGSITNTVTIDFVANAQLAVGVLLLWCICLMRVNFLFERAERPM